MNVSVTVIPHEYRIKKSIQRANPIENLELHGGSYYWIFDGRRHQEKELSQILKSHSATPRDRALADKGMLVLQQIGAYLSWLNEDAFDYFMMTDQLPQLQIPDFLLWHEFERLYCCSGKSEVEGFTKRLVNRLFDSIQAFPTCREGWLLHTGATERFVVTFGLKPERIARETGIVSYDLLRRNTGNSKWTQ
ncbi:TPA: hypothetical protein RQO57_003590 [Aeromonas dhakensis]|uniref:hypothetical protein n=1 Tax=Aeromonas dhakensis TaxID=196024 RepID=UPI00288F00F9|nr:hypothetical protein [Aeromonas dhakensis]